MLNVRCSSAARRWTFDVQCPMFVRCSTLDVRCSMSDVRPLLDVGRSMFNVRCSSAARRWTFDVQCSMFVRCSTLDVRCSMFDVRPLLDVGRSMFNVRCSSAVRCSTFDVRCSSAARRWTFDVECPMFACCSTLDVRCSMSDVRPLFDVGRSMFNVRCSPAEYDKRGKEIDRLDGPQAAPAGRLLARIDNQQRCAGGHVEQSSLGPHALFAQMPAVVAPQHDDRVLAELQSLQGVQHGTQLLVHETDARIVGGDGLPGRFMSTLPARVFTRRCLDAGETAQREHAILAVVPASRWFPHNRDGYATAGTVMLRESPHRRREAGTLRFACPGQDMRDARAGPSPVARPWGQAYGTIRHPQQERTRVHGTRFPAVLPRLWLWRPSVCWSWSTRRVWRRGCLSAERRP